MGEFFGGIWNNIKQQFTNVGTNIGNAIGGAFKSAMNSVLITVENAVNRGIGFINSAIGVINKIPGVSVGSIGAVSLPRLAKGGVLKNGQAIMAEARTGVDFHGKRSGDCYTTYTNSERTQQCRRPVRTAAVIIRQSIFIRQRHFRPMRWQDRRRTRHRRWYRQCKGDKG